MEQSASPDDGRTPVRPAGEPDPAADTAAFQRFQDAADEGDGARSRAFRILTLLAGLAAFVVVVLLLLQ